MGYRYNIPKYEVLSKDSLEKIHGVSLRILEKVGVRIPHDGILRTLSERGIQVDRRGGRVVRFGPDAVMDAVHKASKRHILYGLDGNKRAEFGCGCYNFNGSSGQYQIVDFDGWERRKPTMRDLRNAVKVGDALANINIVGAMVVPSDVPPDTADVICFYELLRGTDKPFTAWVFDGRSARIVIELMEAAAGSAEALRRRPFCELFVEPVSPLAFRAESLDAMIEFIAAGIPVGFSPMVQLGATGPCSVAGTLAQENAEILAGITIAQTLKPGHPVSYGAIPHAFDMRAATISFGSPEQALLAAAGSGLGRFYGFPVYSNTGLSDSKRLDAQFGFESGVTFALGALARSDVFGHLGIVGADNAASLTELVLSDELAGYLIRLFSGFGVEDIEEAYREIEEIGIGGNFFSSEMTLKNFRNAVWYPELFDRAPWESWKRGGAHDAAGRAREKEMRILSTETETRLPADTLRDLDGILDRHEIRLVR